MSGSLILEGNVMVHTPLHLHITYLCRCITFVHLHTHIWGCVFTWTPPSKYKYACYYLESLTVITVCS